MSLGIAIAVIASSCASGAAPQSQATQAAPATAQAAATSGAPVAPTVTVTTAPPATSAPPTATTAAAPTLTAPAAIECPSPPAPPNPPEAQTDLAFPATGDACTRFFFYLYGLPPNQAVSFTYTKVGGGLAVTSSGDVGSTAPDGFYAIGIHRESGFAVGDYVMRVTAGAVSREIAFHVAASAVVTAIPTLALASIPPTVEPATAPPTPAPATAAPTPAPAASTLPNACQLMTAADIQAWVKPTGPAQLTQTALDSICQYPVGRFTFALHLSTGTDAYDSNKANYQKFFPVTDISGVGDRAFYCPIQLGELWFQRGPLLFTISGIGYFNVGLDNAKSLALKILSRT